MPKSAKFSKSIRYSFWDGFFASIQFAIVEQFVVPVALFMGAGSFAIGFLNFLRSVLVSVFQVFSADISGLIRSRKKLIVSSVFLAALFWLPSYFLPFIFASHKVAVFILFFTLASVLNVLPAPAWASLMADYIPPSKRGRYFGWRGTVLGIVYCLGVAGAGLWLSVERVDLFFRFAILIAIASLTRFISCYFLEKMYEPKWRVTRTDYFSLRDFLWHLSRSNFARFALFSSFFIFSVSLVSPFFALFLLEKLKFDYFKYTLVIGASVLTIFLTQIYWGRFGDKYGNIRIIRLTSVLISFVPLFWFISQNYIYLVFVQLIAGFIWAGFNLSSTNFIYDAATSTKRERCISYYNFLSGIGLGFGALLGGFLYKSLPPFLGFSFFTLLYLSFLLRLMSALLIIGFTREVKNVEKVQLRAFLYDLSGLRVIGLMTKELLVRFRRRKASN